MGNTSGRILLPIAHTDVIKIFMTPNYTTPISIPVVTSLKLSYFEYNKTRSDYSVFWFAIGFNITISNDLIIQWGIKQNAPKGYCDILLPLSYQNNYAAVVSSSYQGAGNFALFNKDLNTIRVYSRDGQSDLVQFITIGF